MAFFLSLIFISCGGAQEEQIEEKVLHSEDPACTFDQMIWNQNTKEDDRVCAGPWEYQYHVYQAVHESKNCMIPITDPQTGAVIDFKLGNNCDPLKIKWVKTGIEYAYSKPHISWAQLWNELQPPTTNHGGTISVIGSGSSGLGGFGNPVGPGPVVGLGKKKKELNTDKSSIVCSTCEDKSDPLAMFDCLNFRRIHADRRPGLEEGEALRKQVITKLKQLGELHADKLSQALFPYPDGDKKGTIYDLYHHEPTVQPSCGANLSQDLQGKADISWRLAMCKRLTNEHVAPSFRYELFPECLNLMSKLLEQADAQGTTLRLHVVETRKVMLNLMLLMLSEKDKYTSYKDNDPKNVFLDVKKVKEQLKRIQAWFSGLIKLSQKPSFNDLFFHLHDDLDRAGSAFWHTTREIENIYGNLKGNLDAADQELQNKQNDKAQETIRQALEETLMGALKLDQTVIEALYSMDASTQKSPFDGPVLAKFTGDALMGMAERLDNLSVYHDLACIFRRCSVAKVETPQSRL